MHALRQPVISSYGVPVLSVGAVLIIGGWLDLYLQAAPVSLFICAVMFSAWFGGFRPGLLATILSILAFKYYFVPSIHSLVPETAEIPRLIVFSLAAVFVGFLSARQRSAAVMARIRTLLAGSPVAHGPCDVPSVIREVLPLVEPEIKRHGIRLETSLAPNVPPVMGDRVPLQQVVLNLLLNAAEIPPGRRRIVVRATRDPRDDGPWVLVAVEDAGVGLGEAEAPRLFEAFYTTKPGGLGMGLSISRSIIASHRGRLWATTNPDHGATFHVALPGLR